MVLPIKPAASVSCRRRYATYKASHESDAASLKAMQAAEQLWLDDKKILLEAAAAAEADAAAAASAKWAKYPLTRQILTQTWNHGMMSSSH